MQQHHLTVGFLLVLTPLVAVRWTTRATDTICGHIYTHPPVIQLDSVGPFRLQAPRESIRRHCPEAKDTSYFLTSGFFVQAFGSRIEVLSDVLGPDRGGPTSPIAVISVIGGNLIRTAEGIGPGKRLSDAKRVWGELQIIGCPAGYSYAYVPNRPGLGLYLGVECSGGGTREVAEYPDSLRISRVDIFVPVD